MNKSVVFLVFLLVTPTILVAGEITGFVDVIYQSQQGKYTTFGMGVFEIDYASELSDKVSFEGAIVIEEDEVCLGQTLVDIILFGEKSGLQIGFLDMPFGLDYQVFATPDRKLVTAPIVTELMMHGGWGDVGINFYGSLSPINYNLYIVNGIGVDERTAPVNQLAENNNGKTFGGRIGVSPIKNLELGFSYCRGPYLPNNTKDLLSRKGGYIQCTHNLLELKGEFIYGEEDISGVNKNKQDGHYLQVLGNITEKIYGVARYEGWRNKRKDEITNLTVALGNNLIKNISLRIEYQINNKKTEKKLFSSQIVIGF